MAMTREYPVREPSFSDRALVSFVGVANTSVPRSVSLLHFLAGKTGSQRRALFATPQGCTCLRSQRMACRAGDRGGDLERDPLQGGLSIPPVELQRHGGPTRRCWRCSGSKTVTCSDCSGTGTLSRFCAGGYHKRNQINMAKILGSKWTTYERTFGYNFFTATQKRIDGKVSYILMTAAGDTSVRFWVNMKNLKDRERWACGWLERAERTGMYGTECRTCGGTGAVECPMCRLQPGDIVSL